MEDRITEFILAVIILLAGAVYYSYIRKFSQIILLDILVIIFSLGFGLAPFIAYLNNYNFIRISEQVIILSYSSVFLFIMSLAFTRLFSKYTKELKNFNEPPVKSILLKILEIRPLYIIISFLLVFAIRVIIINEIGILFHYGGGISIDQKLEVPYIYRVLDGLLSVLRWGYIIWAYVYIISKKKNYFYLGIVIIPEIILNIQSRAVILSLILFYFVLYIFLSEKIQIRKIAAPLIILLLIFNFLFPFIRTFRDINQAAGNYGNTFNNLLSSVERASELDSYQINEISRYNVAVRSYLIRDVLFTVESFESNDFLYGETLVAALNYSIPRIINPCKIGSDSPETLVVRRMNIYNEDLNENWIMYAYADFGLPGCILYGILIAFLFIQIERNIIKYGYKNIFLYVCVIGNIIFLSLTIEASSIATFTLIRDAFLLVIFSYFPTLFFQLKKKPYPIK